MDWWDGKYFCRICLKFLGIFEEGISENIDKLVMNVINLILFKELFKIGLDWIERIYWVGLCKGNGKLRDIIVWFFSYRDCVIVFYYKCNFKNYNYNLSILLRVFINEVLIK